MPISFPFFHTSVLCCLPRSYMVMNNLFFLVFFIEISYAYKSSPTQFICIEPSNGLVQTLPSCLPGSILDIENVIYESTVDDSCGGDVRCQVENRNTVLFACNRKRACQIDLSTLRYHINSTCGTTVRFFVQYRCLPVIQDQKDHLCESPTDRRPYLGDINLSCMKNYRLYITTASVGISLKPQGDGTKNFKCNKDVQTSCITDVPNGYRDICDAQSRQECKIRYNQRPILKNCPYGMMSNFSLVEYMCIPDDGISDDVSRIDICSKDIPNRIPTDRGILRSPLYPQGVGQYLSCEKELFVPRQSRLRLYMLEKSLEYSHEFNIKLLKVVRTLEPNELLDVNLTKPKRDEIVKFELKTNHLGNGQFMLYFQIDSRLSEFARFELESGANGRGKFGFNRDWAFVIGGVFLGLLLLLLIILLIIRISKRRAQRRYSKTPNEPKDLQVEQPYLASSAATILPPLGNHHNRPNSGSSTTSSIIMHQMNDGLSDRETLIKPIGELPTRPNAEIDNFYEEIKEQQHQTALALGMNNNKGHQPVPPIRDHHETEPRYQQPKSSNIDDQQIKRSKKPKAHPQPSAPSRHLLENND